MLIGTELLNRNSGVDTIKIHMGIFYRIFINCMLLYVINVHTLNNLDCQVAYFVNFTKSNSVCVE